MEAATAAAAQANAKVKEYTHFLDSVLRPEMKEAKRLLEETEEEVSEYQKLSAAVKQLYTEDADKSIVMAPQQQVDLGYQTVYCRAQIVESPPSSSPDTATAAKLFVHVGLGFHAELEAHEALAFCQQRIEFLKTNQLHQRQQRYTQIHDHFQSSVNILEGLQKVQNRIE